MRQLANLFQKGAVINQFSKLSRHAGHAGLTSAAVLHTSAKSINSSKSYAPFILSMLASAGTGVMAGYLIFNKPEMTMDEIASEIARKAKDNPAALKPITGVYQYFINGWRPVYFPGPEGGAPGFFATPFKPSLNGGVAHVLCKKGDETFYLINIQTRTLNDGTQKNVADLPAGFLNSGDPAELARTQELVTMIGQARKKKPDMSYDQYKSCMEQHSKTLAPGLTVSIDKTINEGVMRECEEEAGFRPEEPGVIFNIVNFNKGGYLVAHILYQFECADLPPLKARVEEGISKSAWVNRRDIHLNKSGENEVSGYVCIDGKKYDFKPYDDIAKHIYKILDLNSDFVLSDSYERSVYNTRTVGL